MQVDYPYTDDQGFTWVDRDGFYCRDNYAAGPCFWCQGLTDRLDVNFGAFFCNSPRCNDEITADLESRG